MAGSAQVRTPSYPLSGAQAAVSDVELALWLRQRCVVDVQDASDGEAPGLRAFVDEFRRLHGDSLAAVVFYGSRLSAFNQSQTSLFDFFLFADGYAPFYRRQRRRDAALNAVLAPNTYYAKVGTGRCKYNVVSLEAFAREVSPRAHDLFHAGRFSKRVAIVWSRDDAATQALCTHLLSAMKTVVPLALSRLGARFTFEEFLYGVLALSYAAEIRVESDSKVAKILDAERAFYEELYGVLLRREVESGAVVFDAEQQCFAQAESTLASRRAQTERLLVRSRRRMYVRWFKYMATLDGWTDLLIEKVERTKGIKIELTPLQRKYPYIFGWSHFFRMMRRGMVK